jgi:hypothetical protein
LVTFYYKWKKTRSQTSAMDSANAKSSLNFDFNSNNLLNAIRSDQATGVNGNGNNTDFDAMNLNSDDSDMADTSFEV